MAIIRHLPTSRFWIAQFARKLPDGAWKTVSRSTKIPVEPPPGSEQTAKELRETAQEIANTYERTANQKLKATCNVAVLCRKFIKHCGKTPLNVCPLHPHCNLVAPPLKTA